MLKSLLDGTSQRLSHKTATIEEGNDWSA